MNESAAQINRQKHRRYRQHANPFTIEAPHKSLNIEDIYGRKAPLALDIGFGEGGFTTDLATNNPQWNVLGLEIRPHFVQWLLETRKDRNLVNLYGIVANANLHLTDLIEEQTVEFVSINFPDPWFKRKHRKRRVVHPEWLSTVLPKLKNGARIHAMTDYEPIGNEIMNTFEKCPDLVNDQGPFIFSENSTTGFISEREIIHSKRNERVYRMSFTYLGPRPLPS